MISTKKIPRDAIDGRQAVSEAATDRVVPKPVPEAQLQDPRKYQLGQLKKRYTARETALRDGSTNLIIDLRPSDPDFPFELDCLECELRIPASYPEEPVALRVKNHDIPRGFALNIERGWDGLVAESPASTLLALTNALDKNLERFLSEEKADTVTLVAFKDSRHLEKAATSLGQAPATPPPETVAPAADPIPRSRYVPEESFTREQIAETKARRAQEVRQLEARMGRASMFQKSADGIVYTLPLEPRRRSDLPVELQAINSVQLIVPLLYPLQPLRILFNDVDSIHAEPLEEHFASKAAQSSQMSLTSHINLLAQNIHLMAKRVGAAAAARADRAEATNKTTQQMEPARPSSQDADPKGKNHVHFIPRPPEWAFADVAGESESSDDSWDSQDESDDGGATVEATQPVTGAAQQAERGTSLSFPSIELHGIELLQVASLSLSVKCERCRTINDVTGLRPEFEKSSTCKKCTTTFLVKFRQEMVHQSSVRAGFVDVSGCTIADMLPSTFLPTCSKCSTASQGLVSVRGEVTTNVCRTCHGKFTFKIPDVKFTRISQGSALPPTAGPRRKQERLGLHAGEPLPDKGTCSHYKKSYRWFRFSCCNKVHPCDRCHDSSEDHIQEWANRMICGWCSREQNYAVEACGFCGRSVIGKKGRGFWEGGKGTRDKRMMSRKDKHKYKRAGGGELRKKD